MMRKLLLAATVFSLPTLAQADAIYGCWTNGAEELKVEHTRIVTPGGASPDAQIDRHNAVYVAPDGERDAGRLLAFRQLNDYAVLRTVWTAAGGSEAGERETWKPCDTSISS